MTLTPKPPDKPSLLAQVAARVLPSGGPTLGQRFRSLVLAGLMLEFVPSIPIFIEKLRTGRVSDQTINLLSGMWVLGLAGATDSRVLAVLCMIDGLLLSATVGLSDLQHGTSAYPWFAKVSMLGTGLAFMVERGYKHLVKGAPCPPFDREEP